MEELTERLIAAARKLIEEVDRRGGAVSAIESGFYQAEIQDSAYRQQQGVESGEKVIVGVNRFQDEVPVEMPLLKVDPQLEARQLERLTRHRKQRSQPAVDRQLHLVQAGAEGTENLLPPIREALAVGATVGEVCGRLRQVFGSWQPLERV